MTPSPPENQPFPRRFRADQLEVEVHRDRPAAGAAAARRVARAILEAQTLKGSANVVFAAAPSQNELLDALANDPDIDWSRVHAFHMDEYLGINPAHPASFRHYLNEHLFAKVALDPARIHLIPAEQADQPLRVCLQYEEMLRARPPDVVCVGIGENGHLAFNDPPVADFDDPVLVKVVRLDHACRLQQVHDGCFTSLDQVPTHAFTLTIPALLSAAQLAVVVPGARKADAVHRTLGGPIETECPASVLRRHPGAVLYLDPHSADTLV